MIICTTCPAVAPVPNTAVAVATVPAVPPKKVTPGAVA